MPMTATVTSRGLPLSLSISLALSRLDFSSSFFHFNFFSLLLFISTYLPFIIIAGTSIEEEEGVCFHAACCRFFSLCLQPSVFFIPP